MTTTEDQTAPFATEFLGLKIAYPLGNGAGVCKTLDDVKMAVRSNAAFLTIGSISLKERGYNPGNVYYRDESTSTVLNALGLPNPGLEYYKKHLPEMVMMAHDAGKPVNVSIVCIDNPEEAGQLIYEVLNLGADIGEINSGSPNVVTGQDKRKRIACYSPELTHRMLSSVQNLVNKDARVTFKVSNFQDMEQLHTLAQIISELSAVKALATSNTDCNNFLFDPKDVTLTKPAISVGFAGGSGPAAKARGLGQVKLWRNAFNALNSPIEVIGIGGVHTGRDVCEYLAVGAKLVQATTLVAESKDWREFDRVFSELVNFRELQQKALQA